MCGPIAQKKCENPALSIFWDAGHLSQNGANIVLLKTEKLNWVLIRSNLAGIMHDVHGGDFFLYHLLVAK
ncbi:hypothetical protein NC651_025644 [Populus alba x Populus x berolinensis]|nr:hypothetical protein NC651_025644 [Populus alba x Populus x berolinensis]